jgi:plastocyanin
MSRAKSAAAVGALALLLLSGIATAIPAASAATTIAVSIPQGAGAGPSAAPGYAPDKIVVVIGVNNTVTWTNNDNLASHTVTSVSGNGSINSGNMVFGAAYSYTFTTPGTYNYYCVYHSWMTGVVVVKSSSTTPTPEFPAAWLALILFAVIAAVVVAAPRIKPSLAAVGPN